uniref:Uncharacterized protein n=1 Tax=Opuntia streptacantha TaxID=393608 RepID=A0A7C9F6F9_OPUST
MATREIHSFSCTYTPKLHLNVKPFLLFFSLLVLSSISFAATIVKSIPGYPGSLPFRLETGYIGTGEEEEIQLFYYYIKSERDPKTDPLLIWLNGGPGASAVSGLVFEIGPLRFNFPACRQSGVPTFELNPYAWTKVASVVFVDSPVGTGFSYSTTSEGYYSDDITASRHIHEFLRKWLLVEHVEFQENPLYIIGDSYSGITVPLVVQEILNGNKAGIRPLMNLKGYSLGNPLTEELLSSRYEFARRVSLLSDELYEATRQSCHGDYENVDARNTRCLKNLQAISNDLDPLCSYHILEPSLYAPIPPKWSREGDYRWVDIWANDLKVREALHIREGTKPHWVRYNTTLAYTTNVKSSFDYHQNFTKESLHALVYSGDQDLAMPYVGSFAWITRLNLPIIDRWRPWFTKGQVAGYTTKYSNARYHLTFATVKGAGHTAAEYKPQECFNMFTKWLRMQSL